MNHEHFIVDNDMCFAINPITRTIASYLNIDKKIMQYDHNSERFTFVIPRYIEGHDMSVSDMIQIHYSNIQQNRKLKNEDIYEVNDVTVDDNTLTFSWLISRNATMYAGPLNFLVRFACLNENSEIIYDWHTNIFEGLTVSSSMNNNSVISEEYSDILDLLSSKVDKVYETDISVTEINGGHKITISDAFNPIREFNVMDGIDGIDGDINFATFKLSPETGHVEVYYTKENMNLTFNINEYGHMEVVI